MIFDVFHDQVIQVFNYKAFFDLFCLNIQGQLNSQKLIAIEDKE